MDYCNQIEVVKVDDMGDFQHIYLMFAEVFEIIEFKHLNKVVNFQVDIDGERHPIQKELAAAVVYNGDSKAFDILLDLYHFLNEKKENEND